MLWEFVGSVDVELVFVLGAVVVVFVSCPPPASSLNELPGFRPAATAAGIADAASVNAASPEHAAARLTDHRRPRHDTRRA
jgi:hypothetical protein